jgi:beta-lactam-binding protein with PASTA domain
VNLAQCVATLRVSKSAEPTYTLQALTTTKWRIPDERGVFFTDAERNLKAWGFRYHSIGVYRGDGAKTSDGTVYRQSPKAGTLAPKKTRVTIWWGYERS